jgi:hypothetical protein
VTPGQRLVIACARLHLEEESRREVIGLLQSGMDWGVVLRLAEWHGVRPLLHRHLGEVAPELVPKPVLVDLWAAYERGARRNRAMAHELLRIVDELQRVDIPSVPYKGPTLASALYGDVALREFSDLDILIRAANIAGARRALEARGYACEFTFAEEGHRAALHSGGHYHLVMRGACALVELHWKTDALFPVERNDDEWWRGLREAAFEGGAVRTFSPDELFVVLCLHGAKHRWGLLAWLVDIAEMMRRADGAEWTRVSERITSMRTRRRCLVGVRLAHDLLGAPVPAALGDALTDGVVAQGASTLTSEILRGSPQPAGPWAMLRRDLALFDRPSQRIRYAFNVIVAPGIAEWSRWSLPRPFAFLYFPLRMARLAAKRLARL